VNTGGRIDGKVALITGAASGLGLATAERFAEEGAVVVGADVTVDAKSEANGVRELDVRDEAAVSALVDAIVAEHGRLDVVVNYAGVAGGGPVHMVDAADWDRVLDVNLKGTFLCAKAVLPDMIARRCGRILNIASIAGKVGEPTASAYSASKFGVIGFTRSLALEVARHDILVNAICPGPIATPLGEQGWREGAEIEGVAIDAIMTRVNGRSPLRRLGTVEQVAKMAVFIASDDCDFTTGSAFNVDGGIIMT
jgi:NAD(P)-dependent dehydrogenase (short-subunit alcohol dehydrogenase family)